MRAPQELKDAHPLGKSPVITDGDVTLAESGAITGGLDVLFPLSIFIPSPQNMLFLSMEEITAL
jgi:glutathione S-transferase